MQPEREDEGAVHSTPRTWKRELREVNQTQSSGVRTLDKENINSVAHLGPGHARTGSVLFISSPITLNAK